MIVLSVPTQPFRTLMITTVIVMTPPFFQIINGSNLLTKITLRLTLALPRTFVTTLMLMNQSQIVSSAMDTIAFTLNHTCFRPSILVYCRVMMPPVLNHTIINFSVRLLIVNMYLLSVIDIMHFSCPPVTYHAMYVVPLRVINTHVARFGARLGVADSTL